MVLAPEMVSLIVLYASSIKAVPIGTMFFHYEFRNSVSSFLHSHLTNAIHPPFLMKIVRQALQREWRQGRARGAFRGPPYLSKQMGHLSSRSILSDTAAL